MGLDLRCYDNADLAEALRALGAHRLQAILRLVVSQVAEEARGTVVVGAARAPEAAGRAVGQAAEAALRRLLLDLFSPGGKKG